MGAASTAPPPSRARGRRTAAESPLHTIVPAPVLVEPRPGAAFTLAPDAEVRVPPGSPGARDVGELLAELLRPATGYPLPVVEGATGPGVVLLLEGAAAEVGDEGYELDTAGDTAVLRANTPAGLWSGVQTLRQLLPAAVESPERQDGPFTAPAVHVLDHPRFPHRGVMLDVARHFFGVDDVKRYLDLAVAHKVNALHLHLSDDQGWRLEVESWPNLTAHGSTSSVGGGPGGFYTQDEYREIVAYAARRHVVVVPEIDLPGHTAAALSSYPELNPDGVAPKLYTGIEVGFSTLDIASETTYRFVADVLREVAALTPGPYLHIGGDEAFATEAGDYRAFMARVLPMVEEHGKRAMGWSEFTRADLPATAVAQYWDTGRPAGPELAEAAARGVRFVLSPANRVYLDMKYAEETELGLKWAGTVEVDATYGWDPATLLDGVPESAVLGVEAPLWTETLTTMSELELMAFPRLAAVAEVGWTAATGRDWADFRSRLAAQGPRWEAKGVAFHPSPTVPWQG
ncbi:beta-N-acetylhexosaminidase [Actinosynnema pretiosum subsp. pretiosum]|uniref:beta-N-acetylhexosaminidase n=1 Tax=Actinosynnema pretiosum subsp. pretiosum TaxID=103721 RepID=A0AA45LBG9_9PSEU|nr:beta-N-acetylhexosaminidase [Actinosynnema pretiosum subsp. pretiosum]